MEYIKKNYRLILIVVGIFAVSFLGGTGLGWLTGGKVASIVDIVRGGRTVNILLMGIDARNLEANSRSDTMILATIDTKNNRIALLWIPRDTRIETSSGGQMKINSINVAKGPEAACEAVGKLVGADVHHYIITNFWGFEKIIDKLGGVTIDVETNFKHYDPDPYLNINIPKGTQRLNGENALKYVRYRGGPTADIGRTQRQAKFLKALADEIFKTKTILKLPDLVPELISSVKTNIPSSDLVYLLTEAGDFSTSSIVTQTLPGHSFTSTKDGASYWEPDKNLAVGIMDKLLEGQTFEVIHDPPTWTSRPQIVTEDDGADTIPPAGEKNTTTEASNGTRTDQTKDDKNQNGSATGSNTQNGTQAAANGKQDNTQGKTTDKELPEDVDKDTTAKSTTPESATTPANRTDS